MYIDFFKLCESPFRLTPDIGFLYMSNAHRRAKSYMAYSVESREGFVVITGEIGSGKTTLIQKLISELDDDVLTAKIFQTQLDEVELLQSVLVEFGLNPFGAQKVQLIDMLNTFLMEQFRNGKRLVLIVDDAHNLGPKVLEEIRMLSGLETQTEKLLQVILVGQPQLNELLEEPDLEQLLQRVGLRFHIEPLSEADTRAYINHRLHVAGGDGERIFAPETMPIIHEYTGGLPRLINTLCDTCLACAYADDVTTVTTAVLNDAIEELRWLPYAKHQSRRRRQAGSKVAVGEYGDLLRDHTRALIHVGNQMTRLDSLVPALTAIAGRMNNIETMLRDVAATLSVPKSDNAKTLMKSD